MLVPSGDQSGCELKSDAAVIACSAPPLAFIVKIRETPSVPRVRSKAIRPLSIFAGSAWATVAALSATASARAVRTRRAACVDEAMTPR
jgi:hypothetical protein